MLVTSRYFLDIDSNFFLRVTYLRERERERESATRGRGKGRENPKQTPTEYGAEVGLDFMTLRS